MPKSFSYFPQVFYLKDPIDCSMGTKLHGSVSMMRQDKNKRLYNLNLSLQVDDETQVLNQAYEIP